jgi:transcriptional regulator with XRE-family HTH domain
MATSNRIQAYFSRRLRIERENRSWSQAHVTQLLKARGVNLHTTSLAKIEAGERTVKIDEAAGIADLFEVPLDSLLGRKAGLESDLAYALRAVSDTARESSHQIARIANTLSERLVDVRVFEFEGRDAFEAEGDRALMALRDALQALHRVSTFEAPREVGQRKGFVERSNTEAQLKQWRESAVDETQS